MSEDRLAYLNGRIAQLHAEIASLHAERRASTADHNDWNKLSRGERKSRKATVRHVNLEVARKSAEIAKLLRERAGIKPVVAEKLERERAEAPNKALQSVRKWIHEIGAPQNTQENTPSSPANQSLPTGLPDRTSSSSSEDKNSP